MLKLIVHHSPSLVAFVCSVHLRLSKPQWQHVVRLADALVVSEARHKTIASLYRLIVDAPDPSNGADTLRISPWVAEDVRAPMRQFIVEDLVTYASQSGQWTLYVSLDDSLGEKDKGTRHLEAVEYHHDHTKSQGPKKPVYTKARDSDELQSRINKTLAEQAAALLRKDEKAFLKPAKDGGADEAWVQALRGAREDSDRALRALRK